MARTEVFLEVGERRVFVSAARWPGWCRSARTEDEATAMLLDYAVRYRDTLHLERFTVPTTVTVAERLKGNATTDFGAPSIAAKSETAPLGSAELRRLVVLLRACWEAFDDAARAAGTKSLRKGPRGGGRDVGAMIEHVLEADRAYLSGLGESFKRVPGASAAETSEGVRSAIVEALGARARGEPPSKPKKSLWAPRFAIRRSAWHALDHAWEIEDRLG